MYWVENVFYIFYFILSEVILFPLIYIKTIITVGFIAEWWRIIPLIIFWMIIGPFVLVFDLGRDLFYYLKLLCDYHDDEDQFKEKEEEDFK
jgi:hypothetical protein